MGLEYFPCPVLHTSLPVRASRAYVPSGPRFTAREAADPHVLQVEK